MQTLDHDEYEIRTAKYFLECGQIATAGDKSIWVWDSDDGQLLVNVKVELNPKLRGLLPWFKYSEIGLQRHGQLLAYFTKDNITFWDTSIRIQLGLIPQSNEGCSIAFSPSSQRLALVQEQKLVIKNLSRVKVRPLVTGSWPFLICTSYTRNYIRIEKVALGAWKNVQSQIRKRY